MKHVGHAHMKVRLRFLVSFRFMTLQMSDQKRTPRNRINSSVHLSYTKINSRNQQQTWDNI